MTTITIFMPVLNGVLYISAALESLSRQSHQDWRLVILDAESTDGTLALVRDAASSDNRIEVRSASDAGQYDALLKGIAETDCDIIGWLNADDLYPPWALAEAARVFEQRSADWITGLPGLWDEEGRLRTLYPVAGRIRRLIEQGWYHDGLLGCLQQECMFFRKRLVDGLTAGERGAILSHKLAGDFALWRAFARQADLISVPTVLGGFRRHGANRSLSGATGYADEVRALGGKTFPGWLARRLRSFHDYKSAIRTMKAARRAAHDLASPE